MRHALRTRRSLLRGWLAVAGAGAGLAGLPSRAAPLPATPFCGEGTVPTLASSEGPFYTPDTPAKRNFRGDAPGEPLTLVGFVLTRDCQPVSGAVVDLWHADSQGRYDNDGFRLRGHQATDGKGRYVFETIVPAVYYGRTRHYHVKVTAPGGPRLTTQLYFPGEPKNDDDFLFDRRLLMRMEAAADGRLGRFDFVLGAG